MDTNLIQTLWVWWGTIPSDFKFLLLLPFAVGSTALLSDVLQQLLAAQGWRPFSVRVDERATRRFNSAPQAAERLDGQPSPEWQDGVYHAPPAKASLSLHGRPELDDAVVGQVEVVGGAVGVWHHRGDQMDASRRHAVRAGRWPG